MQPFPVTGAALKLNRTRLFCLLGAAEGLTALGFLFRQPSEPGSALLLGFSPARLLIGLIALVWVAVLSWLAYRAARVKARLDGWFHSPDVLLAVSLLIGLAGLVLAAWLVLFVTPLYARLQDALVTLPAWASRASDLLRSLYLRAGPLLAWGVLLALQALVFLGLEYTPNYRRSIQEGSLWRAGLVVLMLAAAGFYWAVLLLRLKVFLVIQNWKWYFIDKPYQPALWMYAAVLGLGLGGAWLAFRLLRSRPAAALAAVIGCAYALQAAMGVLGGQGFESLRLTYADSIFNGYAKAAAAEPPLLPALREYEARYGADDYLGTKPPGVLLVYSLVEKVSNAIDPQPTAEGRFVALTRLAAYTFPLLACLVVPVLYGLGKRLAGSEVALLAGLFYVTAPSFLGVQGFLDQALYPLLFGIGLVLTLKLIERAGSGSIRTYGLAFGIGAYFYACLYFSFSLLPLIPLAVAWMGLDALRCGLNMPPRERWGYWKRLAAVLLALAAGAGVMLVILRVGLNYDILLRYRSAFTEHRTTHVFNSFGERAANAMALNNAEFIGFAGFALMTLVLARCLRGLCAGLPGGSVWRDHDGPAVRLEELILVFLLVYFATNLFGQTVGEVQRLFLFFLPPVALFGADEARRLFRGRAWGYGLVVAMQLVTAMLIFMIQPWYG
jgi:hypothetical protein